MATVATNTDESKGNSNPYYDEKLMKNLSSFSPKANHKFLSKHSMPFKLKKGRKEKKEKDKKKLFQIKKRDKKSKSAANQQPAINIIPDTPFTFPTTLPLPPESIEFAKGYNWDGMDRKIEQYLSNKYKQQIAGFDCFYDDTIIRFVVGYRHIAKTPNDFNKRLQETEHVFAEYLQFHRQSGFDRPLNIKQTVNDVPIGQYLNGSYIYGQDKFGHPLLWDEGLKYQKHSDLAIHKNCGEKGMDEVLGYIIKLLHEIKIATNRYYGFPEGVAANIKMMNDVDGDDDHKERSNHHQGRNDRKIGLFRHCIIFDLNGFNSKHTLKNRKIHEFYTKRGSLLAPDQVHKVYVINSPKAFQNIWKILKAFLHPNTITKTKILGKDYMGELLKEIDIHMIPKRFGGRGAWEVNNAYIPKGYPIQISSIAEQQKNNHADDGKQ